MTILQALDNDIEVLDSLVLGMDGKQCDAVRVNHYGDLEPFQHSKWFGPKFVYCGKEEA